MPKKAKKNLPKLTLGILFVCTAVLIGLSTRGEFFFSNVLQKLSPTLEKSYSMYIDPFESEIKFAESQTFISYAIEGTSEGPVDSTWDVLWTNGDRVTDIGLDNCTDSSSCTVYAGGTAGELMVTAQNEDGQAVAHLTIEETPQVTLGFSDEVPEWAETSVAILNERNIMTGYSDGSFGAEDPVTRGQFATLLYRILPLYGLNTDVAVDEYDCDIYKDLAYTYYAYDAVCFAHYTGWFEGLPFNDSSTFSPETPLTREETAQLFYKAMGEDYIYHYLKEDYDFGYDYLHYIIYEAEYYDDQASINNDYYLAIYVTKFFDVMDGTNKLFNPKSTLNRVEAATIIWRIMSNGYFGVDAEITDEMQELLDSYEE